MTSFLLLFDVYTLHILCLVSGANFMSIFLWDIWQSFYILDLTRNTVKFSINVPTDYFQILKKYDGLKFDSLWVLLRENQEGCSSPITRLQEDQENVYLNLPTWYEYFFFTDYHWLSRIIHSADYAVFIWRCSNFDHKRSMQLWQEAEDAKKWWQLKL